MLTVNANIDTSGLQDKATINIEIEQWIYSKMLYL